MAELPEPAVKEHDLLAVLDQELSRLPEKYRTVMVLCSLEGKTKKEAARQLNVPEGTVASRVAAAKAMLAKRLKRSGGMVSCGSLAVLLGQNCAYAAVPKFLINATIKAASLLASSQTAAGVASANAVALSEGVAQTMFITKYKVLAMAVFAVLFGVCLVVGVAWTNGLDSKKTATESLRASADPVTWPSGAEPGTGQKKRDWQECVYRGPGEQTPAARR